MPAISPDSLYGAVHLAGDGHLDPHGATHAVADAARALGVRIRTGVRVTGFELSARREITAVLTDAGPIATEIVVNAAGMWAPQVAAMVGGVHPVDPGRPPARRAQGRARAPSCPATCPASATRTTSSTARASTAGWCSAATRLDPRVALGGRRAVGARGAVAAARLGAVRAADGRRDPALPVPRRRRGDPAGLPPRRDDARRQSAARATPRGSRFLGRGRAVAQRVRGWGRHRPGDGRLDHRRRSRRRHRAVSGVAVQRHLSRSGVRGRARARDLLRLLPAALSRTTRTWPGGRVGCRALHGRLQEAGAVFGTKAGWERADYHEPGRRLASGRARPGRLRLGRAALVRARLRGGARRPRASRASSTCRRSARSRSRDRARSACSSGSAPTTSTDRSAASSTRSGATSAAGWSPTSRSRAWPTTGSGS